MQERYRLQASASFHSVRRDGRSYSHPYLVIAVLPNGLENSRFGFVVGRRIGKAVKRNRIKRWMREAVRLRVKGGQIAAGWDVVLIARNLVAEASHQQVDEAIGFLLRRAGLVSEAR